MDVQRVVADVDARLRASGTEDRAVNEKRYLKSELTHYGVKVPEVRRIVVQTLRQLGPVPRKELIALIEALWAEPIHERRLAAAETARQREGDLRPSDIRLIERLLRESKTWALVDLMAVRCAGPLLQRHPTAGKILDRWATDADFWIRRSALLHDLLELRDERGDWKRFTAYADALLDDDEFFIRKAIGWVLRDTSRKRPDLVYRWILPRASRASGVTVREAVKYLKPSQSRAVMKNYRG